MVISVDFNLDGAEISSHFLQQTITVDGQMTDAENAVNGSSLPFNDQGLLLRSQRGFDILTYIYWLSDKPLPTKLYYQDNAHYTEARDRFPGQLPDMGYLIHDMPDNGLFGYVASIYFSDHFTGSPRTISQHLRRSPALKVNVED